MAKGGVPYWLTSYITMGDVDRVESSVASVERKTSAEVVPMVVSRSTSREVGERLSFWMAWAIGIMFVLLFVGAFDSAMERLAHDIAEALGMWVNSQTLAEIKWLMIVFLVLVAGGIAWLLARALADIGVVQRIVFGSKNCVRAVEKRAETEFLAAEMRQTQQRTGVLIYVSMLERRAVVLADQAVVAKLPKDTWSTLLSDLLASIAAGKMGDGYVRAIEVMGETLAPVFPPQAGDRNELSDRLRILD